jgi:peptide/nickel transport system permease protein
MIAGEDAGPERIAAVRRELGLDQPFWQQYLNWIWKVIQGDMGRSFQTDVPVFHLIMQRLPATVELAIAAMVIALLLAIPTGIISALHKGSWVDFLMITSTSFGIGIPNFWLGILLILVFGLYLGWLPAGGRVPFFEAPLQALQHLILPAFTLALYIASVLSRFLRSSMLEVLHEDYIRTARSKGLGERLIIYRHGLRNALVPMVTVLGAQLGRLVSGAIIVESVFTWPGLGSLMLAAIRNRDYSLVQGSMLIFIFLIIITNLLTDLAYGFIDPRIRLGGKR